MKAEVVNGICTRCGQKVDNRAHTHIKMCDRLPLPPLLFLHFKTSKTTLTTFSRELGADPHTIRMRLYLHDKKEAKRLIKVHGKKYVKHYIKKKRAEMKYKGPPQPSNPWLPYTPKVGTLEL